ncbi:hypothetical protein B566_EDAN006958, partial [Ephemera danica]
MDPLSILASRSACSTGVCAQFFKAGSRDLGVEVNALVQSVDLDAGLRAARQCSLGSLGGRAETSQSARVATQVFLVFTLELVSKVLHHAVVKVLATQVSVSCCGFHLEQRAFVDGEDADIKGAASQVENQHVTLALEVLVESVGECGGRGFVDDAQHIETCDSSRVLGGLTLGVVEVGGHRDHRVSHCGAQVGLGRLLHLHEHHRADLLGGEALAFTLELHLELGFAAVVHYRERPVLHVLLDLGIIVLATNQPLRVEHRVLGSLGVGEGHIAGCGAVPLVVGDDLHFALLVDPHARIRGAQ